MAKTNIEWTEESWNPIVGCSIVSPGCTNCYAMRIAPRTDDMSKGCPVAGNYGGGRLTTNSKAGPVWTGELRFVERRLRAPLKRKKPTTYFVNSMGDLFHEDVPDEWIDKVFAVMALCPQHTFQVLTKRAERMRDYMARIFGSNVAPRGFVCPPWSALLNRVERSWMAANPDYMTDIRPLLLRGFEGGRTLPNGPLDNVWLGVSTERQKEYDERWPHLASTPAAVRFISYEPALGPLNLQSMALTLDHPIKMFPDWVICGGESGHDARPMHPAWPRELRDQCALIGVPFFFKQHGEWLSVHDTTGPALDAFNAGQGTFGEWHGAHFMPRCVCGAGHGTVIRVGKKAAGRLLDGITHDAMPSPPDHVITPPARRAAAAE